MVNARKVKNVIVGIINVILIIVIIVELVRVLAFKKYDFLGFKFYTVMSGSMEPTINTLDVAITKTDGNPQVGDIVAIRQDYKHDTYIHRIVEISGENGETLYRTKGDNNNTEDEGFVKIEQINGIVVGRIPKIGKFFLYVKANLPKVITLIVLFIIIIILIRAIVNRAKFNRKLHEESTSELEEIPKEDKNSENRNDIKSKNSKNLMLIILPVILSITAFSVLKAYSKYRKEMEFQSGATVADFVCEMEVQPVEENKNLINPHCTITVKNYDSTDRITDTDLTYTVEIVPKDTSQVLEYYWEDTSTGKRGENTDSNITGEFTKDSKQYKSYEVVFMNSGIEDITEQVQFNIHAVQKMPV